MLAELLIAAAGLVAPFVAVVRARRSRRPLMLQWGHFVNKRPGLPGNGGPPDDPRTRDPEPEVVEFDDWKWWIRIRPNFGVNLPVIGYWSRANGRRRVSRPWERR